MITDEEGYAVTGKSPVLVADQYDYQIPSASKTAVPKRRLVANLPDAWHVIGCAVAVPDACKRWQLLSFKAQIVYYACTLPDDVPYGAAPAAAVLCCP